MLPELKFNPDGSLTLYLHKKSCREWSKQCNWLPAPDGPMGLVLRLCLPKQAVIDGTWMTPAAERAGP
jgi:hypothetical protein